MNGVWLQYGALGAFALVSLWFYQRVYRDAIARAEAAEKALADLNREVREKVVPALTDATRAVTTAERGHR